MIIMIIEEGGVGGGSISGGWIGRLGGLGPLELGNFRCYGYTFQCIGIRRANENSPLRTL